jgi:hypothetical protein
MSNRQTPYSDFDDFMFNAMGVLFTLLGLIIVGVIILSIYVLNT